MGSTVDQSKSSFTLHIVELDNGMFGLVAIDDKNNFQVHQEYNSPSVAALEGIISLVTNRLKGVSGMDPVVLGNPS